LFAVAGVCSKLAIIRSSLVESNEEETEKIEERVSVLRNILREFLNAAAECCEEEDGIVGGAGGTPLAALVPHFMGADASD
jgi:hypothetical protein